MNDIVIKRRLSMEDALILCLAAGHVQNNPGCSDEDIELVTAIAFAALDNVTESEEPR